MASDLADRLAGGVWGHLAGDAVGVPYEFRDASAIESVEFGAKGTHGQPPGTWSDDGALMLALLDSLLTSKFDLADQGKRAVRWWREKAYTPDGDGLFDIGGATQRSLQRIEDGTPAGEAGGTGIDDNGNGSLMRILPIALVGRDLSDGELIDQAHRASGVTHGHARSLVVCALYVLIAQRLIHGSSRADALGDARTTLRKMYSQGSGSSALLGALDHLEGYPDRAGRGRVWDSFWSAWDAFAGAADHRDTVVHSVRYGNDTDTTAAIAGGLAGIRWGLGGIDPDWLNRMRGHAIVDPMVDALVASAGPYRTSTSHPIRVDFVDRAAVTGWTGRLGMTFLPGKRDVGRGGHHWRTIEEDVRVLREAHGVDTLLLLVEDSELGTVGLSGRLPVIESARIEVLRFPIPDGGVPAERGSFQQVVSEVDSQLAAGQTVAIACRGGLGRTGMIAACLLRRRGMDSAAALALTRATRHDTVETAGQEQFVKAFS